MATTTNFGWETPDDTDLVKDGAAAIRTVANSIDTSFVDLKGGTTNQVLAKNSNTDLDFKWVADATGIPATIIDAKGDLIVGTAADTASRLAVGGTNGHVLQVDSGETAGIKWGAVPGLAKSFALLNSGGTALTGAQTITVNLGASYDMVLVLVQGASSVTAGVTIGVRLNGVTTGYRNYGAVWEAPTTYSNDATYNTDTGSYPYATLGFMANNAASTITGGLMIFGAATSGIKVFHGAAGAARGGGTSAGIEHKWGYLDTTAITSISVYSSSGNLDAGTVFVYGAL